ncbi:hypothetical protein A4H97_33010 [Niastella yeongjuensis]|uniref:Uncharacterized protein n=1 Tax=Niastella yeongjuensis TaxID=354355 RepID=A0A1V9EGI8_9BACT|nr:hypothetical protein A4H97_33010 [Niastella yeongjuensis]
MSLFLTVAVLPNCMVEIITGRAELHVSAPFGAIVRIVSFPVFSTDVKMLMTSLEILLRLFIIRIFWFSKSI